MDESAGAGPRVITGSTGRSIRQSSHDSFRVDTRRGGMKSPNSWYDKNSCQPKASHVCRPGLGLNGFTHVMTMPRINPMHAPRVRVSRRQSPLVREGPSWSGTDSRFFLSCRFSLYRRTRRAYSDPHMCEMSMARITSMKWGLGMKAAGPSQRQHTRGFRQL